jgi:hypothetical protein
MITLFFILKVCGISVGFGIFSGMLMGFISRLSVKDHPHQIIPTPLLFGFLGLFCSLIASAIFATIYVIIDIVNIIRPIQLSCIMTTIFLLFITIKACLTRRKNLKKWKNLNNAS